MLGATDGARASIPPNPREFSATQLRDWNTGKELVKTCMATHDTKTYVRLLHTLARHVEV